MLALWFDDKIFQRASDKLKIVIVHADDKRTKISALLNHGLQRHIRPKNLSRCAGRD